MSLSIYLFFPGNCAEAFDFYRSVFGGEFAMSSTYGDAPPDMGVADADKDKLMHVSLPVGDSVLMGSDAMGDMGEGKSAGGSFAITYSPASKEEADAVFAKLTDGGEVQMEMQETFWGAYFGQGTDKFGIRWMINVNLHGE